MFKIDIPADVKYLIDILKSVPKGSRPMLHKAYIVGGCVRDSLLGKTPHDWDICTSVKPEQVCEILRSHDDITVIETGLKHGTVTAHLNGENYEITTFRIDGKYSDNRRPDSVEFVDDVRQDLARRDFTINAMAYDEWFGLIDPFNGHTDLVQGRIRCVGDPEERFEEDALRMLRALRFASTYGFVIEENTSREIHRRKEWLRNISAERIQSELSKMLLGHGILDILWGYADVFTVIIPELGPCIGFKQNNPHHVHTVYDHMTLSVAMYNDFNLDLSIRLALLLHDIGKPGCYTEDENGVGHFYKHAIDSAEIAETVLRRLKFDNKTIDEVTTLVLYHDVDIKTTTKSVRRWLNKIGPDMLKKLIRTRIADVDAQGGVGEFDRLIDLTKIENVVHQVISEQQCFQVKDLAINGNDILGLGMTPGPMVGKILNSILNSIIDGELENEHDILIEEAKRYI